MNLRTAVFLSFGAISVMGFSACAKSKSSYPDNPKDVLQAFLDADGRAADLSAATWPELALYTTWQKPPTWDKFVVITGYDLGEVRSASTRAQIPVTYHKVGLMGNTFTPEPGTEQVVFYLNKVDGEWKVDLPQIVPHVTSEVIQRRLNESSTTDPKTKAANDALVSQIMAAEQRH